MHLHGFNMYIVAQGGPGEAYNGTVVRPNNPMRRDTFTTAAYGYTVFQFDAADNPGMWPFHCHMAVHSATGMVMQFLTSPDKVAEYEIPSKLNDACAAWIDAALPGGIDSGA
jgi:FtsP/CotA-like multicopper oxidase with cupredoxin domain